MNSVVWGQAQQPFDRAIHLYGVPAGEIASGSADIRHEQRIADEDLCISNSIGDVRRRMARHVQNLHRYAADVEDLIRFEQRVELRAIQQEVGLEIVDIPKRALHDGDLRTDADLAASLGFEVSAGREVIGMGVCFQ